MKTLILMAAMLVALPAYAVDADEISRITGEIERLQSAGVSMHKKYNLAYDDHFMRCAQESRPLRAQAKPLREQAMKLNTMAYRVKLVQAADDVFVCVYCSESAVKSCGLIPPVTKEVRQWLTSEVE